MPWAIRAGGFLLAACALSGSYRAFRSAERDRHCFPRVVTQLKITSYGVWSPDDERFVFAERTTSSESDSTPRFGTTVRGEVSPTSLRRLSTVRGIATNQWRD
jgi:hypothetical protein